MTLFSSIKTELLTQRLVYGSIIAAIGALILVFGGALLPPDSLSKWGLPLFLIGIGLITIGMIPYRRLKRLESDPYVIKIEEDTLSCLRAGKTLYQVKIDTIKDMHYCEESARYGIEMEFKDPTQKNLFFPYFTRNSFDRLKDTIS